MSRLEILYSQLSSHIYGQKEKKKNPNMRDDEVFLPTYQNIISQDIKYTYVKTSEILGLSTKVTKVGNYVVLD